MRAAFWVVLLPVACCLLAVPRVLAEGSVAHELRLETLDYELEEIGAMISAAHFRTALALVQATRELLDAAGVHRHRSIRRARLEVMAATAEVALGQRVAAQQSMVRALRADSALDLDARETSPKVLELLGEVRRQSPPAERLQ